MPTGTTALTVLAPVGDERGPTWDEQASDVSPGNNFDNAHGTFLYARNTTASPIDLIFEADIYGSEITVLQVTIPGSGTENGVKVLGPFPPKAFSDHRTTEAASDGKVFVRQASGIDGDVVLCPFRANETLLATPGHVFWPAPGTPAAPVLALPAGYDMWLSSADIDGDDTNNSAYTDLDSVTTWVDKGSLGKDVTQATTSMKPTYREAVINGFDVVSFDGGDLLRASTASDWDFLSSSPDWTALGVWKHDTSSGSDRLFDTRNTGVGSGGVFIGRDPDFRMLVSGSSATALNCENGGGSSLGNTDWHYATMDLDDSESPDAELRLDGASDSTANKTAAFDGVARAAITIGCDGGSSFFLTGDVADVIIWTPNLSTGDRGDAEAWAADRYAL